MRFLIFLLFLQLVLSISYGDEEIPDNITGMELLQINQNILDVSANNFACEKPELVERKITHYVEPQIKNGLTMKEGQRHELWKTNVCDRSVTFGFVIKVAPERINGASLSMEFSEINESLFDNPDINIQKKYEKLIIGKWEKENNGKDGLYSSSTYDDKDRLLYTWKNGDYPKGEEIQEYELIGNVLCHTVLETTSFSSPIGFKQCMEIEEINKHDLVFKGHNGETYSLKRSE